MRQCITATFGGAYEPGRPDLHVQMWIDWQFGRVSALLDTHRAGFWVDCRRAWRRLRGR